MRGTMPLRLWLALALVAIVGLPALTTWALSTALVTRPSSGDLAALAAVRNILGDDPVRWSDPAWQHLARQRLVALHVDVLLDDTTGHQVFATTHATTFVPWASPANHSSPSAQSVRITGLIPRPPRVLVALPLYSFPRPANGPHSSGRHTSGNSATVPGIVGIASVWLVPASPAPGPPPVWLVPLATLATLLLTLAAITWALGRLILRPLAALSRAAGQIAGGDLAIRLPHSRAREVAEVAAALGGMSGALRESLRRQDALEEERRLFVGAIAHDLHTPLFVLRGYLQGLENGVATTPEKVAAYVAECRLKVDALARLISDLFAYTKVEYLDQTMDQALLDLGTLLRQTLSGLQPLATEKDIALVVDGPNAPSPLMGDRHLLTRAVENLVDNALRHTPSGGEVRVCWGAERCLFTIRVADTGPGIAPHDLPHLFTPLYRGESSRNRQTGGAGLGLTIARRIMQAHGGDLTAANGATGGALFTATLPIADHVSTPTTSITSTVPR